jgi:hypothetical protein
MIVTYFLIISSIFIDAAAKAGVVSREGDVVLPLNGGAGSLDGEGRADGELRVQVRATHVVLFCSRCSSFLPTGTRCLSHLLLLS